MDAREPLRTALADLERRAEAARVRTERLEADLATARAELAHAQGAIDHITSLIEPAPTPVEKRPSFGNGSFDSTLTSLTEAIARMSADNLKGMDAVEAALKNSPRALTLEELTEAVNRLGWHPEAEDQERAVRAAGNRLRKKNPDIAYIAKRWLYRPRHAHQQPVLDDLIGGSREDK